MLFISISRVQVCQTQSGLTPDLTGSDKQGTMRFKGIPAYAFPATCQVQTTAQLARVVHVAPTCRHGKDISSWVCYYIRCSMNANVSCRTNGVVNSGDAIHIAATGVIV